MGPSRRTTSTPPRASGSKIPARRQQGYGPSPHVKPHSATLATTASHPAELLTQNQVCTKLGMLQPAAAGRAGVAAAPAPGLGAAGPGQRAGPGAVHGLVPG